MEAVDIAREITSSLRVLGLEPGASASDVRQAFRRLARTCHPDVAGRGGTFRFQQIAGAYTLLKGLAPEELRNLQHASGGTNIHDVRDERDARATKKRGPLFRWNSRDRKASENEPERNRQAQQEQQDRSGARTGAQTGARAKGASEQERARREAQAREAQEREARVLRRARVDYVLDQYDTSISRCLERLERSMDESLVSDIIVRLGSNVPEVRRLALSRMGSLVNRKDVMQALIAMLRVKNRGDGELIDEDTARLVTTLPMNPETRRRIASDVAGNAAAFPDFLISSLLNLRDMTDAPDPSLLERYLVSAGPSGVALVLYRWPNGEVPTLSVLERILERADSRALVPLFVAMKQKFPRAIPSLKSSFEKLLEHPDAAVRVWCQVFLKQMAAGN